MSSRIIRYTLTGLTVATLTLGAVGVVLAAIMLRTPQHCGWCGNEHRHLDLDIAAKVALATPQENP